jgi:hypothetical protein
MLIGLLVVLITFGLGGAAQEERAAPATTRATLTVMDMSPLAISGRGFKSGERVAVSTGTARKSVTASASGRFVVRFGTVRCAATTIVAVGSKGSRATTKPPKILCVEP